ncbi:unnamed protein product [Gongylonema pulchrum]|uniref:Uncharacterized protein n=1 Tax=Gongylonema pulchrum TaxID=637853 RepID=A0A183E0H7_9BILA|nr:unnamed protein product [Gongylonema pulchrum]
MAWKAITGLLSFPFRALLLLSLIVASAVTYGPSWAGSGPASPNSGQLRAESILVNSKIAKSDEEAASSIHFGVIVRNQAHLGYIMLLYLIPFDLGPLSELASAALSYKMVDYADLFNFLFLKF